MRIFQTMCAVLMCFQEAESLVCIPGHFLYTPKEGPDTCLECFPGTFMPLHLHTYRQCFECSQVHDPDLEIIVMHCNTLQDTHIQCIDGYFRTKSSYPEIRGHCQKCTSCEFVFSDCQKERDSICCPDHDFAVRINGDGDPVCVRLCGPGQFLDVATGQCVTCPEGTFMSDNRHTNIHCWSCDVPKHDHEVVMQPCGVTQPAIIGCEKGYYRRSLPIYPWQDCAQCQVCSENTSGHVHQVLACNSTYDTVCCGHPDMKVVDTPEGPQCELPATTVSATVSKRTEEDVFSIVVKRCEKGEHLSIEPDGSQATCLPCPEGTCMSENKHFRTSCQRCAAQEDGMSSVTQAMSSSCAQLTVWKFADLVVIIACCFLMSGIWYF